MALIVKRSTKLGGNWKGVEPGITGPDWQPPPEVNANFGEIKPITNAPSKVAGQARNWGFPEENLNGPTISTGHYIFYDPQTGNYWIGIIAP